MNMILIIACYIIVNSVLPSTELPMMNVKLSQAPCCDRADSQEFVPVGADVRSSHKQVLINRTSCTRARVSGYWRWHTRVFTRSSFSCTCVRTSDWHARLPRTPIIISWNDTHVCQYERQTVSRPYNKSSILALADDRCNEVKNVVLGEESRHIRLRWHVPNSAHIVFKTRVEFSDFLSTIIREFLQHTRRSWSNWRVY